MVVGIKQTSSAINTVIVIGTPFARDLHAIKRVRQQGGTHDQEDDGEASQ